MEKSQAVTPWYLDKAVYMVVLSFLLPFLSKKFGVALSAEEIAGFIVTVVSFIALHKYKSGKIVVEEIKAAAAVKVSAIPTSTSPQEAADKINSLGK